MGHASESVRMLMRLSLFNIDISITSATIVIWTAALLVFFAAFLATRRPTVIPGKLQNLIEIVYEFWELQTKDLLKDRAFMWLPFIFAVFCFVLVSNLLGLIPGVYPLTANINATATLAIIVFFVYHAAGIMDRGPVGYFRSMIPPGVPIFAAPVIFVIEILGHFARPFSLAIRLFANETAGHLVALTLLSLILMSKNVWIAGLPLLGRVVIGLFEVFVAFIQAYVFAYLASLYIGLAISEEH